MAVISSAPKSIYGRAGRSGGGSRSALDQPAGTLSATSSQTGVVYSSVEERKVAAVVAAQPVLETPAMSRYEQASSAAQYYAEAGGAGRLAQQARTRALFLSTTPTTFQTKVQDEYPTAGSRTTDKTLTSTRIPTGQEAAVEKLERAALLDYTSTLKFAPGERQKENMFTGTPGEQAVKKKISDFYGTGIVGTIKRETQSVQLTPGEYTTATALAFQESREAIKQKDAEFIREGLFHTAELERLDTRATELMAQAQKAGIHTQEGGRLNLEATKLEAKQWWLGLKASAVPLTFSPKDTTGKTMLVDYGGRKMSYQMAEYTQYQQANNPFYSKTNKPLSTAEQATYGQSKEKYLSAFTMQTGGITKKEMDSIGFKSAATLGVFAAANVATAGTLTPVIGVASAGLVTSAATGGLIVGSRVRTAQREGKNIKSALVLGTADVAVFELVGRGPGFVKSKFYTEISVPLPPRGGGGGDGPKFETSFFQTYRGVRIGERSIIGAYGFKPVVGSPAKVLAQAVKTKSVGVSSADFIKTSTPATARIIKEIAINEKLGSASRKLELISDIGKSLRSEVQSPSEIGMLPGKTRATTPGELAAVRSWGVGERAVEVGSDVHAAGVGESKLISTRARFIEAEPSSLGVKDIDLNIPKIEARIERSVKKKLLPSVESVQKAEGLGRTISVENPLMPTTKAPGKEGVQLLDLKGTDTPATAPETFLGITIEKEPIPYFGVTQKGKETILGSPLRQQLLAKAEASTQLRVENGELFFGAAPERYNKDIADFFSASETLVEKLPAPKRAGVKAKLTELETYYPKVKMEGGAKDVVIIKSGKSSVGPSLRSGSVGGLIFSSSASKSLGSSFKSSVSPSSFKSPSISVPSYGSGSPSFFGSGSSKSPSDYSYGSYGSGSPSPYSPGSSKGSSQYSSSGPREIIGGGGGWGNLPGFTIPGMGGGRKRGGSRFKKLYTPSIEAIVFNVKGKKPKGIETGLGIRPMVR